MSTVLIAINFAILGFTCFMFAAIARLCGRLEQLLIRTAAETKQLGELWKQIEAKGILLP